MIVVYTGPEVEMASDSHDIKVSIHLYWIARKIYCVSLFIFDKIDQVEQKNVA